MAKRASILGAVLGGGLTAGAADFIYASVFYYVWRQIPPVKIWQSVAGGVLGKAAPDGGYGAAALGVGLHFFITILMAAAFVPVSQGLRFLARTPLVFGPLYGLFLITS